jgi:hypothetical protein
MSTELKAVIDAARKLVKGKGRFHTEQNYGALVQALAALDATSVSDKVAGNLDHMSDDVIDLLARKNCLDGSMLTGHRYDYWRAFARDLIAADRASREQVSEDEPPLPVWALMDNLGNIVPSDVRKEMRQYGDARAAHAVAKVLRGVGGDDGLRIALAEVTEKVGRLAAENLGLMRDNRDLDAKLAQARAAGGAREGWQCVPVEPTGVMKDAGAFSGLPVECAQPWIAGQVYRAMLAAAPKHGDDAGGSTQCREDGRCQYAINHGAEGLGHCPEGRCCMPKLVGDDAGEVA